MALRKNQALHFLLFLLSLSCSLAAQRSPFVGVNAEKSTFELDGASFRLAGTNCYYLIYQDQFMVDDALETAANNSFQVIRTWAFIDIGYQNGTGSIDGQGSKNGVYFQYWDPALNAPNYNDTNLNYLDYVLYKASQLKLKILLTLTNNWRDFGGMDQYVRWKTFSNSSYQGYHDDFYADPEIKSWYQKWVQHLVTRKNSYNGLLYRDDPTIFAWELGNEPRCQGSGDYSESNQCVLNYAVYGVDPNPVRITNWVWEMSSYIKSIDSNHLVAVGDEGFYCNRYEVCPDITCDCYYGTDALNFTQAPGIDFMSLHLYPDQWGKTADWGDQWIMNHTQQAHSFGKPALLGEYGMRNNQHQTYQQWTTTIYTNNTDGDLFWMISGRSDQPNDNGWYPNYDGYAVYCPNTTDPPQPSSWDPQSCPILSAHAKQMAS